MTDPPSSTPFRRGHPEDAGEPPLGDASDEGRRDQRARDAKPHRHSAVGRGYMAGGVASASRAHGPHAVPATAAPAGVRVDDRSDREAS